MDEAREKALQVAKAIQEELNTAQGIKEDIQEYLNEGNRMTMKMMIRGNNKQLKQDLESVLKILDSRIKYRLEEWREIAKMERLDVDLVKVCTVEPTPEFITIPDDDENV